MTAARRICLAVIVTASVLISFPKKACADEAGSRYAAIAYSKSTGRWGWARNHETLDGAKKAALSGCAVSDAKVIVWSKNGYCALALGSKVGSYGYGYAADAKTAQDIALTNAQKYTTGCHIVVSVSASRSSRLARGVLYLRGAD